jgi:hypothetical protein
MSVKGTAVAALPKFIEQKLGRDKYDQWFKALPAESKKLFSDEILASAWYPIKDACVAPTEAMCRLFYGEQSQGARELGAFSAEVGLRGIYRAFVKLHSFPAFMNRSCAILEAYYRPCAAEVTEISANRACLKIKVFPGDAALVEYRIAGWMEKAMQIHGKKNPRVEIVKSLTRNDPYTELVATWQ